MASRAAPAAASMRWRVVLALAAPASALAALALACRAASRASTARSFQTSARHAYQAPFPTDHSAQPTHATSSSATMQR